MASPAGRVQTVRRSSERKVNSTSHYCASLYTSLCQKSCGESIPYKPSGRMRTPTSAPNRPNHRRKAARPMSFTSQLLASQPGRFQRATEAPFLKAAGQGSVSLLKVSQWLSQDRLYAQAYIGFIGSIIALVDLPMEFVPDKESNLSWRLVNLLTAAIDNLRYELDFFADVAKRYDLNLECPYQEQEAANGGTPTTMGPPPPPFRPIASTLEYLSIFESFRTQCSNRPTNRVLLEALVVLWATEQCYLSAWDYAKGFMYQADPEINTDNDADGGALRREFIPNWTSTEFHQIVNEIARLTDDVAEELNACPSDPSLQHFWVSVLECERSFWPSI